MVTPVFQSMHTHFLNPSAHVLVFLYVHAGPNSNLCWKGSLCYPLFGSKRQKVLKSDFFYYIPVENTLKQLLQQPDILAEIDHFHGSRDGILWDICDGDMFRKHPLFSTDEKAIQIIAYYDEIELCNPLGSNTKVHKLGCVFFTLGNFHPSYRSWLKSIFLIAVASAPTIKLHGIDEFLRPFVDDIKRLSSNGLHCISLNGERRHF